MRGQGTVEGRALAVLKWRTILKQLRGLWFTFVLCLFFYLKKCTCLLYCFFSVRRLLLKYSRKYNTVHAGDVFIYSSLTLLTYNVGVMYSYEQEITRLQSDYFLFITFFVGLFQFIFCFFIC